MPTPPADSARLARHAKAGLWCGILALVFFLTIWAAGMCVALLRQGNAQEVGREEGALFGFIVLICGGLSLVLSIVSIVLGAMGRKPGNTVNRGVATAGVVLGSVALGLNVCCLVVGVFGVIVAFRGFK